VRTVLTAVVSAAITLGATALVASARSDRSDDPNSPHIVRIGDTVDMKRIDLRCRYLPSSTGASGSPSFTCQRRSLVVSGAVMVRGSLVDVGERTIAVFPANHRVKLLRAGRVQTVDAGSASVDRAP
jgi:hypothetical protein